MLSLSTSKDEKSASNFAFEYKLESGSGKFSWSVFGVYLWEWPSITDKIAVPLVLSSWTSHSYSFWKNSIYSSSVGTGMLGSGGHVTVFFCMNEMLQISSYCTLPVLLGRTQAQGISVLDSPSFRFTIAKTAYMRAAACEHASPSPALQVQWAAKIVPSSWTTIHGCVGVKLTAWEWFTLRENSRPISLIKSTHLSINAFASQCHVTHTTVFFFCFCFTVY